jgi:GT2 family glycosyltransferase
MSGRPPVTVIVPFSGSGEELRACLAGLARLTLSPGDELLIADNRPAGRLAPTPPVAAPAGDGSVRLLAAGGVRAAGYARNQAARVAAGEWLVFIDADAAPLASLLDRYFDPLPSPGTAILAGGIRDRPGGTTLAARHSARRGHMSQRVTLDRRGTPYAQSANMAVRRTGFAAVGGFDERVRSGEDADLCFRLARAGWGLEERDHAAVEHRTRATLAGLLAQLARHGSGAAWLNRRYPGEFPAPGPRQLAGRVVRAGIDATGLGLRGRREAAAVALLQLAQSCAFDAGRLLSNRARDR